MTTANDLRIDLPFTDHPRLRVEATLAGNNVLVWQGADGPSQVDLRLRPVPEGETPHLVAREISPEDVQVETSGGEVAVNLRLSRGSWFSLLGGRSRRAEVTLYVPGGLTAAARVPAGRIDAEGLGRAELDLLNTMGGTRVAEVQGLLEARSKMGRVEVERCSGTMNVRSDMGRVTVADASGTLRARSDVGRIEVRRFSGTLDVHSDVGAVDLDVAELAPGTHHVRSSVGRVRVWLPYGAPVHVVTWSDVGRVRNEFPPAASPKATLEIRTSVGGIDVAPSGSPAAAEERRRRRDEERMRILTMLERGEITIQEAESLLESLG